MKERHCEAQPQSDRGGWVPGGSPGPGGLGHPEPQPEPRDHSDPHGNGNGYGHRDGYGHTEPHALAYGNRAASSAPLRLRHAGPGMRAPVEKLVMRFHDGPLKGSKVMERTWPLPDLIPAPNWIGAYRKVEESVSELPQISSGLLRGAEYKWDPSWRLPGAEERKP